MVLPIRVFSLLFLIGVLLAGPLTFSAGSAWAQETSSASERFREAEAHLRSGEMARGISLLEELREGDPESYPYYARLKEAYEDAKRYDDAVSLIEERIERGYDSPSLRAEKARILHVSGEEEAARETWREVIERFPEEEGTYRAVYQALIQVRLFTQAIDLLHEARSALERPEAFRIELAYLYNVTGQHEQAMEEYLALIDENEQQFSFVQRRLDSFLEQEEARQQSIAAASRAARDDPRNPVFQHVLAWLYLQDDQYEQALEGYRALDQLVDESGQALFDFAREAAEAGAYETALAAFEDLLERHPRSELVPHARKGLGDMHFQIGERDEDEEAYRQAQETYSAFLQQHPDHEAAPSVQQRLGDLQLHVLHQLEEAEATLRQVLADSPNSPAAEHARLGLAQVALLNDQLDEAADQLSELAETAHLDEITQHANLELARVHFYRGALEESQEALRQVAGATASTLANDAIRLRVLLAENAQFGAEPLQQYARAELMKRQRAHEAALDELETLLAEYPQLPIADDARFLQAQLLREMGRPQEALDIFLAIPSRFPQSPLADQSLFAAAQLQAQELEAQDEAIESYLRLLEEFPGSVLIPDVRERLRLLRSAR